MGGDEDIVWSFSSASCGTLGAVALACQGWVVGTVGADSARPSASVSASGPLPSSCSLVFGRDLVRALHRYALVAGALPRACLAARRVGVGSRSGRETGCSSRRSCSYSSSLARRTNLTGRG